MSRVAGSVRGTLRELEVLARKAGAPVRYEPVRVSSGVSEVGRGGLVRLRGATFIVCDSTLPPIDRVFVVVSALRALEVEVLHLPPLLRALARRRG